MATASDVTRAITLLDAPFVYQNSESYHKHFITFRERTAFLAANNAALTPEIQLSKFIPTMLNSAHGASFAPTIHRFQHDNSVIGAVGRNLDALSLHLAIDAQILDTSPRAYGAKALPSQSP